MHMRHGLFVLLVPCALAGLGPPEPGELSETGVVSETDIDIDGADTLELGTDELLTPPLWDQPGGYWLSLEMIGPRGAQLDAAQALARAPVVAALPRSGSPPPGELVGRVETLDEALTWVAAHAFSSGDETDATPIPGGELFGAYGVVLTSLVVTGPLPSGASAYPWPPAHAMQLPAGVDWQPASLAVARVPVFSSPAASVPPAAERYQVATLDDAVWLLDSRDSCEQDRCLRWAQILVRHGDRFFGGYVPATQVVPDSAWVSGPGERRLALLPGHRDGGEVGFALIEQRQDRREPAVGLLHARVGHEWPAAAVEVIGEQLVVVIDGEPKLSRHLETTPLPLLP